MKRRNVDSSKTRRPVKKIPKLYDGFYTSLVVYVKLIVLWICVMGGDFILGFRLEYLYPIYLLLHNAYEAYKFQGVAFALLLVCIVVSVDVICLGVVPAPWLYLLGSLAVWGQVGWNMTPLVSLFLLPFLAYLDAKSIREPPSQSLSPLAAHCVGFPMVSLGFALKSFVGSKLKQRTRDDVGRQNELLFSILWDALPTISTPVNNNEVINNGSAVLVKKQQSPPTSRRKSIENGEVVRGGDSSSGDITILPYQNGKHHISGGSVGAIGSSISTVGGGGERHTPPSSTKEANHHNHNHGNQSSSNGSSSSVPTNSNNSLPNANSSSHSNSNSANHYASPCPTCAAAVLAPKKKKDDCCIKLESEVRRLRSDLHSVRSVESDLRSQISSLQTSERNLRGDVALLQGEHEALQLKYSALLSKSQEERQSYEKKLSEERRQKDNAIKKQTKASLECSGDCKRKLRDAETVKETLRREVKLGEEKIMRLERELQNVKSTLMHEQKNKESSAETARLMSLLTSLQDQNAQLESSLSSETRLKLDLFSALGEARRQVSIRDNILKAKDEELKDLHSKYVELLAVSDFTSHHAQQQQRNQQQLNHNHVNHLRHDQLQQNLGQQTSQQQQHRLKNLVGAGDVSPQQVGRENLTYSPLIES